MVSGIAMDSLIHLAAVRYPSNEQELEVNARLPRLLENALTQASPGARFIYLSSINVVLSERIDTYSIGKRQAEAALKNSAAIIVRASILWSWGDGAGGDAGRLYNYLNRPLPFHPVPLPGQIYHPVMVEALANRLVELLHEQNPRSIINVFGDKTVTIWELAKLMSKRTGARVVPIPTAFLEKTLPQIVLRRLPMAIRSIDAAAFSNLINRPTDETWVLPFTLPSVDG
jgi:nucleoside-diphosphate-sugar epimerase